ncbi:MAG TPA: DUF2203 domain-containing protein [Terriglobales bacterium]
MSDDELKTFSLREAQELLPVLESLLRTCMRAKSMMDEIDAEFQELNAQVFVNGGMLVDVKTYARRKAEREKAVQRAKDALGEITAAGVQVKDLDMGLLDFPCKVEGEIILLCWRLGEDAITHWHSVEEGFAGRKPIDERIANAPGSD